MSANENVVLAADTCCEVGEGPLWHPGVNLLFFLDIPPGAIYSYDPATSQCRRFSQGRPTGGMTLQEDGRILLFQDGRVSRLELDGTQHELARGLCPGNERFNDVIADPKGRVFAGAMGGNGRLYRFDLDGRIEELFDGLVVPNGMGFSPDVETFYFTESAAHTIYRFDYDRSTGAITNRRVLVEVPKSDGLPDGMTVDAEGFIWTALWFGGRLQRYAPDGTLDREFYLPVNQTSCVTFGGFDFSDMYVTTAASAGADEFKPPGYDPALHPRGGALYKCRIPGISGRPEFRSRLYL
jgi:D-xylonolactonase